MELPHLSYVDTAAGQLHVRSWEGAPDSPVAVCLHPVPYSGRYFHAFAAAYREHGRVIALDLPGYGGSARLEEPPTIETYATVVGEALDALSERRRAPAGYMPVGFHTGSAVGGELAVSRPDLVSRVAFVTYPFATAEQRRAQLDGLKNPPPLPGELAELESRWQFAVGNRPSALPLDDAFEYFTEYLRAGDRYWFGFDAMFRYAPEQRLPRIKQPVLVVNPPDALHEWTGRAIEHLKDPRVRAIDYGEKAVFHLHPERLADLIAEFATS